MSQGEIQVRRTVEAVKKNGKMGVALVIMAVGVLLLLVGGHVSSKEEEGTSVPSEGEVTRLDMEAYRQALEQRVCAICVRVQGVGKTSAVVTLEGGYEYVYASDVKNAVGGESHQYIIIGSGSEEQLVYLTQRTPTITGIGVVCEGGNDPTVRREVIGLLAAAFGVGSNKIYVTGGG